MERLIFGSRKRKRHVTVRGLEATGTASRRVRTTDRDFPSASTSAQYSDEIADSEAPLDTESLSEFADVDAQSAHAAHSFGPIQLAASALTASSGKEYQSHAQRRINEEKNYALFRKSRQSLLASDGFQDAEAARLEAERTIKRDRLLERSREATCPKCGQAASDCGDPFASTAVCLVSQTEFVDADIPIFKCTRCPTNTLFHIPPEMAGAFGSSPIFSVDLTRASDSKERRWFDITMLEAFSAMRRASPSLSVEAMTQSMFSMHRSRQGNTMTSQDTVRKQIGKALEEYENIQFLLEREIGSVLEDGSIVDCCLSCSSHRGGDGSSGGKCHVYVDGNFRLPHLREAGTATVHDPPIAHRILNNEAVRSFCNNPELNLPTAQSNECNDFSADAVLNRSNRKYDITGVFGAFCRHGFLLCALNMTTGERWSYATFILNLLILSGITPTCVWYDINCRYKGHFLRWVENKADFGPENTAAATAIKWPLPTWHHSMHNAECQAKNSYRTMAGVGRGAGEPPEAAWSYFGAHGLLLQYNSLPSRQAALERIAAHWNSQKLLGLANLLRRMFIRADSAQTAAATEAQQIIEHAMSLGISYEQLSAAVSQLSRVPADDVRADEEDWELQYVDLLLQLDAMTRIIGSRVSPELLALSSHASRLHDLTKKIKVQEDLRRLEENKGIDLRWEQGGQLFEAAFLRLCDAKRKQMQLKIAQLVQQLLYLEALFSKIANRRTDTKKLQRVKDAQRQKVKRAAQYWHEWERAANGGGSEKLAPEVEAQILNGQYPWHSSTHEGAIEAFAPQVKLQLELQSRCEEEKSLLLAELRSALETADRQLGRADKWSQELAGEVQQLDAQVAEIEQNGHESAQLEFEPAAQIVELKQIRSQKLGMQRRLNLKQKELEAIRSSLETALQSVSSPGNNGPEQSDRDLSADECEVSF